MEDVTHFDDMAFSDEIAAPGTARARRGLYARGGKRLLDVLLVLLGLPFVLPVMILIALAIRLEGGPVFYSQPRLGQGGRSFRFWKFRSMCPDADARLARHLAADPKARREWQVTQKLRRDPRVTRVGRVLRCTSLDELPQLWNVLAGDMSLVGPRPMMPDQRPLYPGRDYERLRPGITGPWQVSARNDVSFAARARFDSRYAGEVGLRTAVVILWRTVGAVVRGSGC